MYYSVYKIKPPTYINHLSNEPLFHEPLLGMVTIVGFTWISLHDVNMWYFFHGYASITDKQWVYVVVKTGRYYII